MPSRIPRSVIEQAKEIGERKLIRYLKNIGSECVDAAVTNGNYTDQTHNLRSSIGFVVCKDGSVAEEGGFFNLGGSDGPTIGRRVAYERAGQTSGLTLIVVAGMEYAEYVADRGFDVLDSADIVAKRLIRQLSNG